MRAALAALALLVGGGGAAAATDRDPPAGPPQDPRARLERIERCAGFFVFSAASATRADGLTAQAASRVNRRRAATYLDLALDLRARMSPSRQGPQAEAAAASVVRVAGAYARMFGHAAPPPYSAMVKDGLMQTDRRRCLSLRWDAAMMDEDAR